MSACRRDARWGPTTARGVH